MLTCSSVAAALIVGTRQLFVAAPTSSSSSCKKSSLLLFSLKQCVHKNVTTSQQCFLSTGTAAASTTATISSSSPPSPPLEVEEEVGKKWRGYVAPVIQRRHRHPQDHHCCSLNLNNHHITFHYINSSIVTTSNLTTTSTHYRRRHYHQQQPCRFTHHQSSSSSAPPANFSSSSSNIISSHSTASINDNNVTLLMGGGGGGGGGVKNSKENQEDQQDGKGKEENEEGWLVQQQLLLQEEEEEILKDQVWSKAPAYLPTFNVGAYANDSENVKKLVQLGVDLSKWEHRYGAIPLLYKSNFEKTMEPIIKFFMDLEVEARDLSIILTKNPFIFNEQVANLKKRVEYLKVKRFEDDEIRNIISRNPYWLSFSVPRIDRRLGFFQTYFGLTGDQVRKLASVGGSGPKLITYNLGRVKDVTFTIKEEMGFTSEEIVKLLLTRPRLWKEVPATLRLRFDYLHNEEKFSHADFLRSPMLLLTRKRRMQERIGFLKKLGRAQFDPQQANYISPESLCTGNDAEWATDVARVPVAEYNNYLKTL